MATQTRERASFSAADIAERYNVGMTRAYKIMHMIEYVNDGLILGPGRVLWSEIEFYESRRGRRPGQDHIPTSKEIREWEVTRIAPLSESDTEEAGE